MTNQSPDHDQADLLSRLPALSVKVITTLSGVLASLTGLYIALISPDTDWLLVGSLAAFIVAFTAFGLALYITARKKRSPAIDGEGPVVTPAFPTEARRSAKRRLIPIGFTLIIMALSMYGLSQWLKPVISHVQISALDDEIVTVTGTGFGSEVSEILVLFDEARQVPLHVSQDQIEVRVPEGFHQGSISVRRGARHSSPAYFSYPGVVYDTAVVELIAPTSFTTGGLLNLIEPFPGFPYYSRDSDHPSQWPPRVWKERDAFHNKIQSLLNEPDTKSEIDQWISDGSLPVSVPGRDQSETLVRYTNLRYLAAAQGLPGLRSEVGPLSEQAVLALERERRTLTENLPNRMLILRVRNRLNKDVMKFTAEFKVGGSVYDVTLNAEGEQARSLKWSPSRQTVDIPLLRPSYTAEIQIWYYRQPLNERVFSDARDVQWEQTEGIVIQNLSISAGLVRRSTRLLEDFQAYRRFHVDPVSGSPTFGRLPEPSKPTPSLHMDEPDDPTPPPPITVTEAGPYALLVATDQFGRYPQRDDAFVAQAALAQAYTEFSHALQAAVTTRGGYWIFERMVAPVAEYNAFSGAYLMEGSQLAILYVDNAFEVSALPGWSTIKHSAGGGFEFIPWKKAGYEVVLHYFSDPEDSRGDSKRLLTNRLKLGQIFDLDAAKRGERNVMSSLFADILRFSRKQLKERYQADFTLDDVTDPVDPFYLVVRHRKVSENFYLPMDWMPVAETPSKGEPDVVSIAPHLSRLYDYGEGSRQLSKEEFMQIFGIR